MKTLKVAKRIIKQIRGDKRTVGLMMIAPLILLSLVYALFDSNNENPNVGVFNVNQTIIKEIKDNDVNIITYEDSNVISEKTIEDNLIAFIEYKDDSYNVTYNNINYTQTMSINGIIQSSILKDTIQNAFDDLTKIINQIAPNIDVKSTDDAFDLNINNEYLNLDENVTFYDTISPIFPGFFVFFFVFLISGISLINERSSGTLERMLSTPIKRSNIVYGYLIGYGFFAIIQTIIIVLFSVYVLNTPMNGNIYLVIFTNILIALTALSLGVLLSSFAKTEFQMMQFIPLVVIPQIFFSGIIDVSSMANWLQMLAKIFPLFYGIEALRDVMLEGQNIADIGNLLLILVIFILVFSIVNILVLKKSRRV